MRTLLEKIFFQWRYGISSRMRVWGYRRLGMQIGAHTRMERIRVRRPNQIMVGSHNAFTQGVWLWPLDRIFDGIRIRIGDYNYFNRDVILDACGAIEIGSHNMFGPGVYITDSDHTQAPSKWVRENPMREGQVVIGDGCWVGARAVILKDVRLGNRCVVGAGAVVTRDVPPGCVVAGVPARPMRVANDGN